MNPKRLALDNYLDSSHQSAVPSVAPSLVAGGGRGVLKQSSSTSGIFCQGDAQSQAPDNSGRSNIGLPSGDMNRGVRSSTGNSSGPSVGASSMVTDGNSALSGGPHLQRSASINTDSYLRLPASPMSFSSNNISGSSVMDGGSIMQQSSYQEQMQKQGASSATSQSASQDPGFLVQPLKKPRLDIRQDDILQPQVIQQLLQRQDTSQSQRPNPQMHALMQQKLLQQQMLQSLPPMQRAHIQQQQQLRQQMQQQVLQQGPYTKRPFDSGICARRLMQYMYHQRHRPPDNNIHYWRKFVAEYFSPRAKKKWCMSSYDNVGNHALGVFGQAATDAWHCDICGSKTGKGFEATFEILPRLNRIKFDSGITDELLFLEMPHECRLASGIMLLEYAKVTQASIYDQLRVVREGQLRIIFTPDLKILSWEFCARRHEEFLPRRLVAPQVNQLLQVAQKYQNAVTENASSGVAPQDLQTNCNMFVTAGRQLARNLELQSLNDLGFSKRFIRCLQISEVVNSMKDLIDFSGEHKNGPIECLKIFPRHAAVKLQNQKMQEPDPIMNPQNFPNDQSTVNKLSTIHPGPVSAVNKIQSVPGMLNTSPQSSTALNNYQIFMRQNSTNSNLSAVQMDHVNGVSQAQLQGSVPPSPGSLTNTSANALLATQHQSLCANLPQQNSSPASPVNHHLQQHVIQLLLQEMMNNNRGIPQQSLCGPNLKGNAGKEVFGSGNCSAGEMPILRSTGSMGNAVQFVNGPSTTNDAVGLNSNGSNNFKSVPNLNNPTILGNNSFQLKQEMPASFQVKEEMPSSFQVKQEMSPSLQLPDLVQDMADFADSGIFNDVPETWAMG